MRVMSHIRHIIISWDACLISCIYISSLSHSSYSEGDHCPLRLSGLPAAHTFFWVIPESPAPYFTVHSVGCMQPTPSSEWFLKARTLFHLVSEWFLKARTLFHRSLSEMQLVQDSVKKSCTHQDSVKKILPAAQFFHQKSWDSLSQKLSSPVDNRN